MENLKMVLQDGTEMEIAEFSLPMHIVVHCSTKEDALAKWALLTQENLSTVQIQQNGEVLFAFQYAGLTGVQYILNADETITAHFYMQGERLASLMRSMSLLPRSCWERRSKDGSY